MEYTALWGPKGFIVSPSKIVPLMDLSTSFAIKSESGNDTSGASVTNTKGRELQSVSLSTLYVRGAGVDPRGQIAEWEALVGQSHPLYIEGKRFGPPKLMLESVDVSDVLLNNAGVFLQCAIAVKFKENAEPEPVKTNSKNTALNAKPKPVDKTTKKPIPKAVDIK